MGWSDVHLDEGMLDVRQQVVDTGHGLVLGPPNAFRQVSWPGCLHEYRPQVARGAMMSEPMRLVPTCERGIAVARSPPTAQVFSTATLDTLCDAFAGRKIDEQRRVPIQLRCVHRSTVWRTHPARPGGRPEGPGAVWTGSARAGRRSETVAESGTCLRAAGAAPLSASGLGDETDRQNRPSCVCDHRACSSRDRSHRLLSRVEGPRGRRSGRTHEEPASIFAAAAQVLLRRQHASGSCFASQRVVRRGAPTQRLR